uniref:NADH-ubiquinone oxidoreductase chain 5 n=1 Tax=Chaoborus sp. ZK-2019 TaxID=2527953 RepID=A0A411NHG4_9DIPT|nr:NADH dehydrogenase subunit 5 [Chaoborus sp. ZK-2019]
MGIISLCSLSFIFLLINSLVMFLLSVLFLLNDFVVFIEWDLMSFLSTSIVMTLLFDWMSFLFISFVSLISCVVIFYSKEYMSYDKDINRFIFLVLLFVLSMVFLIISPNMISILLGWDGLGLVSYLLVIYFQNVKSYNAGMITALSNRVGDVAILISIAWMLNFGSWSFIFYLDFLKTNFDMLLIGSLVMLAGMTKSAQIPFSAWLPAAMAAPTPVSALVHSSTLVTAGVYLLIRFNLLFIDSLLGKILLMIGGLTMFMAGVAANFEIDLKKIIALSTLSQLGLMMSVLALGFFKLAFFHLLTHALFKALLFMCAGVMIHQMKNSQDIRYMGGFMNFMPLISSYFMVSNLALCGMPFLAGFYSKDLILEMVYFSNVNLLVFFLFVFSTGLTVMYSFRLFFYSLTREFNLSGYSSILDSFNIMLKSMSGLLVMSIIGGSLLSWMIFPIPYMVFLPFMLKMLTLFICFLGGGCGYILSLLKSKNFFSNYKSMLFMKSFLSMMWFMPILSTLGILRLPLKSGEKMLNYLDQGWTEIFGGQMIYYQLMNYSYFYQKLYFNNLKVYLLFFILWIMILFFMNLMLEF